MRSAIKVDAEIVCASPVRSNNCENSCLTTLGNVNTARKMRETYSGLWLTASRSNPSVIFFSGLSAFLKSRE